MSSNICVYLNAQHPQRDQWATLNSERVTVMPVEGDFSTEVTRVWSESATNREWLVCVGSALVDDPQQVLAALRQEIDGQNNMHIWPGSHVAANVWSTQTPLASALWGGVGTEFAWAAPSSLLSSLNRLRNVEHPLWHRLVTACENYPKVVVHPLSAHAPIVFGDRPGLTFSSPRPMPGWLQDRILKTTPTALCGHTIGDATALRSVLALWQDWFDTSHSLAQNIEGEGSQRAGDYCHAVLHRREPDDFNSRYWFHRVGPSPVPGWMTQELQNSPLWDKYLEGLRWKEKLLASGGWNTDAFVELCRQARQKKSPLTDLAEELQALEISLLFRSAVEEIHK